MKDKSSNDTGIKKIKIGISLKFSLAIIMLVSAIVLSIAIFIVYRESKLLKNQIFNFAKREVIHLSNAAQQNIGFDELSLADAVQELKKIDYFTYVFVLNSKNEVLYYFDRRDESGDNKEGQVMDASIARNLEAGSNPDAIDVVDYEHKLSGAVIYDFSKVVYKRVGDRLK